MLPRSLRSLLGRFTSSEGLAPTSRARTTLETLCREVEGNEAAIFECVSALTLSLKTDSSGDPFHQVFAEFVGAVRAQGRARIMEIGACDSAVRDSFADLDYVGMDIRGGAAVDVVGDAHELSRLFEDQLGTFDAVYALSVFEHLLMPWRVALEINRVLRTGGLVFASTHQTWPPHEVPWDFWRYSDTSFDALFNAHTGFRIRRRAAGLPCTIIPLGTDASMTGILGQRAYLGVSVLAEKVSAPSPDLRWDLTAMDIVDTRYPGHGSVATTETL